jgi:hypothetical protein
MRALIALILSSSVAIAQADSAAVSIKRAAVAAFRDHPNAARNNAVASRPLVLDPVVFPMHWNDNGVMGMSPERSVLRDSAQSLLLSAGLGGAVASSADALPCVRREGRDPPGQCKLLGVVIVSVGEPRPWGSDVSLLIKTTSPLQLADGSVTLTRYGSLYLLRMNRVDGVWRIRCLTNIPDTIGGPPPCAVP